MGTVHKSRAVAQKSIRGVNFKGWAFSQPFFKQKLGGLMRYLFVFLIFSSLLFSNEVFFEKPKTVEGIFEIPVKIKAQEPFTALQFTLKYENTLKYEGFRWGDLTQGSLNALNDKLEGQIKGALASANPLPKEGVVFYIKFSGKGEIKFTEFLINDKPAKIQQEKYEIKKK